MTDLIAGAEGGSSGMDEGLLRVISFQGGRGSGPGQDDIEKSIAQLLKLVEGERRSRIVLDFRYVQYLHGTSLASILRLKKKVEGLGGALKLCGLWPSLVDVFRISRLETLFAIYPDLQSALDSFRAAQLQAGAGVRAGEDG